MPAKHIWQGFTRFQGTTGKNKMPEIIADNISIVNSNELEGTTRIDAEYYQPEYLNIEGHLLNTANYKLWKDINGRFITGPFGSSFNVENYVSYPPYRYIRGKDVKDFFLLDDDNVYIPEKDYERLKKYVLYEEDILISVVGTLGNAVIVDKNNIPSVFSCKSTAFRTNTLNPFFLIAYLNCLFGKKLLQRKVRGAVQTGLNIDDLKLLPIYLPNTESQNKIAKLVIDAKNNLEQSKVLYSQAESLLLEELGIKDIDLSHEPCYEVNSADTISANRIDAEYYQPKYERVIEVVSKRQQMHTIADVFDFKRGEFIDTKYYTENKTSRPYIRIKELSNNSTINSDEVVYIKDEYKNSKTAILKKGDLVIAIIGDTIGKTNLILEEFEGGFCSNNTAILRLKESYKNRFNLFFLEKLFHSIFIQLQIEKRKAQTGQPKIADKEVKEIEIPLVDYQKQCAIGDLIRQSHSARRQAKELLEQAKQKVEEMIEKGTLNGMKKMF